MTTPKVRRNTRSTGWFVTGVEGPCKFYDRDYGDDSETSYWAAHAALEDANRTPHLRKQETRTRTNKKSLDVLGITYYSVRDGRQVKHRFAVCDPNTGKPKMVHIGNDNTYAKNWDAKLAESIELRERLVREHGKR